MWIVYYNHRPCGWLSGGRVYRIGKHPTSDVRLPDDDKSVSRLHLTLDIGLGPLQEISPEGESITPAHTPSFSSSVPSPRLSSSTQSNRFPASIIPPVKVMDISTYGTTVTAVRVIWQKERRNGKRKNQPEPEDVEKEKSESECCSSFHQEEGGRATPEVVVLDSSSVLPGMADYHPPSWMFPSQQYQEVEENNDEGEEEDGGEGKEKVGVAGVWQETRESHPPPSRGSFLLPLLPSPVSSLHPTFRDKKGGALKVSSIIHEPKRLERGIPYALPVWEGQPSSTSTSSLSHRVFDFLNEDWVLSTPPSPFLCSSTPHFRTVLESLNSRHAASHVGKVEEGEEVKKRYEDKKVNNRAAGRTQHGRSSPLSCSFSPSLPHPLGTASVAPPPTSSRHNDSPDGADDDHLGEDTRCSAFRIQLGHRHTTILLVWVELTAMVEDVDDDCSATLSSELQQCGIRLLSVPITHAVKTSRTNISNNNHNNHNDDDDNDGDEEIRSNRSRPSRPSSMCPYPYLPFTGGKYEDYFLVDETHFYITDGLPPSISALRLVCRGFLDSPIASSSSSPLRDQCKLEQDPNKNLSRRGDEEEKERRGDDEHQPGGGLMRRCDGGKRECRSESDRCAHNSRRRKIYSTVMQTSASLPSVMVVHPDYVHHLLNRRLVVSESNMGSGGKGGDEAGPTVHVAPQNPPISSPLCVSSCWTISPFRGVPWCIPPSPHHFPPTNVHPFWAFMISPLPPSSTPSVPALGEGKQAWAHLSRAKNRSCLFDDFIFIVVQPKLWNEVQAYIPAAMGMVYWDPFVCSFFMNLQRRRRKETKKKRGWKINSGERTEGKPKMEEDDDEEFPEDCLKEKMKECATSWISSYHPSSPWCSSFLFPSSFLLGPPSSMEVTSSFFSSSMARRSLVILYNKDEPLIPTTEENETGETSTCSSTDEDDNGDGACARLSCASRGGGVIGDGSEKEERWTDSIKREEEGRSRRGAGLGERPRGRRATSGSGSAPKAIKMEEERWRSLWIPAVHSALSKNCRELSRRNKREEEKEEPRRGASTERSHPDDNTDRPCRHDSSDESVDGGSYGSGRSSPVWSGPPTFSFLRASGEEDSNGALEGRERSGTRRGGDTTPPLLPRRGRRRKGESRKDIKVVPMVEYAELLGSLVSAVPLPSFLSRSPFYRSWSESSVEEEEEEENVNKKERRMGSHDMEGGESEESFLHVRPNVTEMCEKESEEAVAQTNGKNDYHEGEVQRAEETGGIAESSGARPSVGTLLFDYDHNQRRDGEEWERIRRGGKVRVRSPLPSSNPNEKEEGEEEESRGDDQEGWIHAWHCRSGQGKTSRRITKSTPKHEEGSPRGGGDPSLPYPPISAPPGSMDTPAPAVYEWRSLQSSLASYPCFSGLFSFTSLLPTTVPSGGEGKCIHHPHAYPPPPPLSSFTLSVGQSGGLSSLFFPGEGCAADHDAAWRGGKTFQKQKIVHTSLSLPSTILSSSSLPLSPPSVGENVGPPPPSLLPTSTAFETCPSLSTGRRPASLRFLSSSANRGDDSGPRGGGGCGSASTTGRSSTVGRMRGGRGGRGRRGKQTYLRPEQTQEGGTSHGRHHHLPSPSFPNRKRGRMSGTEVGEKDEEESDVEDIFSPGYTRPGPHSTVPPILLAQLGFQGEEDEDSEEDDNDYYGTAARRMTR